MTARSEPKFGWAIIDAFLRSCWDKTTGKLITGRLIGEMGDVINVADMISRIEYAADSFCAALDGATGKIMVADGKVTANVSQPQKLLDGVNASVGPTGFFNRNEVGMRLTPLSVDYYVSAALVGTLLLEFSIDGVNVHYSQSIAIDQAGAAFVSTDVTNKSAPHVRYTWTKTSGAGLLTSWLTGEVPVLWQPD